ncbi:hypothetical protein H6P81_017921 [Aristolochia fimbriata]|uniref:Pectinesterase catalytic domain-containing protein n=1 Tax=Aristolochia fimbriata TaxID=158543 RepID=A0AAV7E2L1_ARIFI|nr:hypothetical protein H6P81_017921 [Aristolochia fimbriata]
MPTTELTSEGQIISRILNYLTVLIMMATAVLVVVKFTVSRHQEHSSPSTSVVIIPQITVALDGSGDFTSISDAVAAVPNFSEDYFGILIIAGFYREVVRVPKEKTRIVFIGEGPLRTIISSNRSEAEGWRKESTAAAWVSGEGFVAINITFENTADPGNGYAVSFFNEAKKSALYLCGFKSYENAIEASRNTQFYRECTIYGAVNVISGDAAAVFQTCTINMGKPARGDSVLTVQNRITLIYLTAFVFHNCTVDAAPRMPGDAVAYLGKPGGEYSTVVLLQSFLGGIVSPRGWIAAGANVSVLNTVYYGEYENRGPGAGTSERVSWAGFRVIRDASEANKFTLGSFIDGKQWLPKTSVKFVEGLI